MFAPVSCHCSQLVIKTLHFEQQPFPKPFSDLRVKSVGLAMEFAHSLPFTHAPCSGRFSAETRSYFYSYLGFLQTLYSCIHTCTSSGLYGGAAKFTACLKAAQEISFSRVEAVSLFVVISLKPICCEITCMSYFLTDPHKVPMYLIYLQIWISVINKCKLTFISGSDSCFHFLFSMYI